MGGLIAIALEWGTAEPAWMAAVFVLLARMGPF